MGSKSLIDEVTRRSVELASSAFPVRAPAKVNLRLKVVGRRPDGYHLLNMINCTTSLCDEIVVRFPVAGSLSVKVEPAGLVVGDIAQNLVVKAFRAFWREFLGEEGSHNISVGFDCTIEKHIPIGAGLGGGSSDAGAVLRVLSSAFGARIRHHLQLSEREFLVRILSAALTCGADVPFAYIGGLARVGGIGERVEPLSGKLLPPSTIIIATPSVGVSTQDFYARFRVRNPTIEPCEDNVASLLEQDTDRPWELSRIITNDFEACVCEMCPPVQVLLDVIRRTGGVRGGVTGSGSAVFAVVPTTVGSKEVVPDGVRSKMPSDVKKVNELLIEELQACGAKTFEAQWSI